jgi:hypothetical protein
MKRSGGGSTKSSKTISAGDAHLRAELCSAVEPPRLNLKDTLI